MRMSFERVFCALTVCLSRPQRHTHTHTRRAQVHKNKAPPTPPPTEGVAAQWQYKYIVNGSSPKDLPAGAHLWSTRVGQSQGDSNVVV